MILTASHSGGRLSPSSEFDSSPLVRSLINCEIAEEHSHDCGANGPTLKII